MKRILTITALAAAAVASAQTGTQPRSRVQLICHRTANRDIPENTIESLEYAARMGCDEIELDIRTTLDGQLVLHHDGYLERLTDGMGDVANASVDELALYDAGGWMSSRFSPMHIPRFEDALRVAREHGIKLDLDIKQSGEGAAIFAALAREGMIERVNFGSEENFADDLRALMPKTYHQPISYLPATASAEQIEASHAQGKFVVVNFSANTSVDSHEMDLDLMRAAVANGADALNVDYPRLGADAVGRPVEAKLAKLATQAMHGDVVARTFAIRELSHYPGFPMQDLFARLLEDPNAQVSRAAAVALVIARPATPAQIFLSALSSKQTSARQNAAWALGITHANATDALLPLLTHTDPVELKEVLLALSKCEGEVPAEALTPFLKHAIPTVRAAAALALARHQPTLAAQAIPELLQRDEQRSASDYAKYVQRGKPELNQAEIDVIVEEYREHMKLVHALETLPERAALPLLTREAFRVSEDSSHVTSVLAGYSLWDHIVDNPTLALPALESDVPEVADRAEWILIKADPAVLPAVRAAVHGASHAARVRLVHVMAWKGDAAALPLIRELMQSSPKDRDLLNWAMQKIEMLRFAPPER